MNLRVNALICFGCMLGASIGNAASRDDLIGEIEASYASATLLNANSPLIDMLLAGARSANPRATAAAWQSVKIDAAKAIGKTFLAKGSPLDMLMKDSLKELSDSELQNLKKMPANPAYRKFQAAMTAPQAQKKMLAGMMEMSSQMTDAINGVVLAHQMNEAH